MQLSTLVLLLVSFLANARADYHLPLSVSYLIPETKSGIKLTFPAEGDFQNITSGAFYAWIDDTVEDARIHFQKAVLDGIKPPSSGNFKLSVEENKYVGYSHGEVLGSLPGKWMVFWIQVTLPNGTRLYNPHVEHQLPYEESIDEIPLKFTTEGSAIPPSIPGDAAEQLTKTVYRPRPTDDNGEGDNFSVSAAGLVLAITIPIILILIIIIIAIILIMRYRQKFQLVTTTTLHQQERTDTYYSIPKDRQEDSKDIYTVPEHDFSNVQAPLESSLVSVPLNYNCQQPITPPANRPLPDTPDPEAHYHVLVCEAEQTTSEEKLDRPAATKEQETVEKQVPLTPLTDDNGYIDINRANKIVKMQSVDTQIDKSSESKTDTTAN